MVALISALLLIAAGGFSVYIIIKCSDLKWVKLCFAGLCAIELLSVIGAVCVSVGCMETVARLADEGVQNGKSAYFSFMLVSGVFSLVILIISLGASLMRHRLILVRSLVAYLGAVANVAVISPMFCMLFNLFGVDIDIYVEILALCFGVLCTLPVNLDVYRLMKQMSTPEGLAERERSLRPPRKRRRRR